MQRDKVDHTTQTHVGPIYHGLKIYQKFTAAHDHLEGVSFLMATYMQTIESTVRVTILTADQRHELRAVSMNTRWLTDNAWQRFSFSPLADSAGQTYWFCVETDGAPERSILAD